MWIQIKNIAALIKCTYTITHVLILDSCVAGLLHEPWGPTAWVRFR